MNKNITVIGIGKLGLGLALLIEKGGYNVCGVDIFPQYVESLNKKEYRTKEPQYSELLNNSKNFFATTNIEEGVNYADIIFIVVQTPNSGGDRFYDHSILSNLLTKINSYKIKNKHIVIGCTVMPKYIDTIGKYLLEDCENTTLNYNPEFVAQGEIVKGFLNPDIILIGIDETNKNDLSSKLKTIYDSFVLTKPKYCILTPLEAEIVKISLNGFITTKLSFANMISDVCDSVGADKHKVLDSIGSDTRIGNKYFRPGYSFGGPCFPRDTRALKQFVEQTHINSDLLKATTKYNEEHIIFQANQLLSENKAEYIFENVCYKENSEIALIEESAKLKIAKKMAEEGRKVTIKTNKETLEEIKKEYGNLFTLQII
jgi:UDPglucose 6-dehydrogenase